MSEISATEVGIEPGRGVPVRVAEDNARVLADLLTDAAGTGREVLLDFYEADFADTVFVRAPHGLSVRGAGPRATRMRWIGGPDFQASRYTGEAEPSTFLHLENGLDCSFTGFEISTPHPLGYAIRSTTVRGENVPASRLSFEHVNVDSINGACLQPFLCDDPLGGDANNDLHRFIACHATYGFGQAHGDVYRDHRAAGWEFRNRMSMGHFLSGCSASQTGYRTRLGYGMAFGVIGSSYVWEGGAFNLNDSCFLHERTDDLIEIRGNVQCEGNRAFFWSTDWNALSGLPVSIRGVRFATNRCEDGDVLIDVQNNMQLSVSAFSVSGSYDVAVIPVRFRARSTAGWKTPHTNAPTLDVRSCNLRTRTPEAQCIQTAPHVRSWLTNNRREWRERVDGEDVYHFSMLPEVA